MIPSPIMRGLTSYFSSIDAKTAIYSDSFELISSPCMDYFKNLDISAIVADPPVKDEKIYSVKAGDEKAVISVTPVFKSKRIVAAYAFVVRSDYYIYKMMNAGIIADYTNYTLEKHRDHITDVIQNNKIIIECIKKGESTEETLDLLEKQNDILIDVYSELNRTRYSAFADSGYKRVNCNVTALLSALCSEAELCFREVKREVIIDIEQRNYYAKIDFNLLTIAISNLLHFHLYTSPLKSKIHISTLCDEESCIEITLRSKLDKTGYEELQDKASALFLRDLAHKIICYDCNGEYKLNQNDKELESKIMIPVSKKNRGSLLTSKNSAYLGMDFKPLHSSLSGIIASEMQKLKKTK